MLNPNPHYNSVFWKWLGHKGGALMNKMSECSLTPSTCEDTSRSEKQALTRHHIWRHLDFDFPAPKLWETNTVWATQSSVFCYSSPNRLRCMRGDKTTILSQSTSELQSSLCDNTYLCKFASIYTKYNWRMHIFQAPRYTYQKVTLFSFKKKILHSIYAKSMHKL